MFNKFLTLFLSTIVVLISSSSLLGQTTLFFDDMESYTAGTGLACQNPVDWDTWGNAPCDATEDALVSSNFAASGVNSTVITQNNDVIHRFGDLTSGKYNISFQIYIPAGKSGYFNTMSRFDTGPFHWAMDVFFDAGGSGTLLTGGPDVNFSWLEDTWQGVTVVVDLDTDAAEFWFAGSMVHSWAWTNSSSAGTGPLTLAVNDFFGNAATDEMYFDDYRVEQFGPVPISWAREDLDGDYVPDHLGETVTIQGTISSPNYSTGNFNYVIHDGTAGITSIFFGYGGPEYNMGDVVQVTGEVSQFAGLTQIEPAADSNVVFIGTGGTLPDHTVLTLEQYFMDPESYEGELLGFVSLSAAGGGDSWPTSGSNANFNLTDALGVDTLAMRIDKETDLDDNPEPSWPRDVIGFGGQFTFDSPPNNGYQNLPRMYSEILPSGTIPVELTSFTAQASGQNVDLNWSTATELNNHGFEIERKSEGAFRTIGFVEGHGTTTEAKNYIYTDTFLKIGTYYYRLKQVDFSGNYEYSDAVEVEIIAPDVFALQQNYPNPFNPNTRITFNLAIDSKVSLKVFDVLGQEVAELISSNLAGIHNFDFNASGINSGVYFYKFEATGIDGSAITDVKKMILAK